MKRSITLIMALCCLILTACNNASIGVIGGADGPTNIIVSEQNNISSDDDYLTSIIEQSDIIKASLEQETLTQADMNLKSEKLYKLWDNALNDLWGKLKDSLSDEEFSKLLDEQRIWIAEKEKNVEEAGKEVEGGSMYSLVVSMEDAKITEERVRELYELLKELN